MWIDVNDDDLERWVEYLEIENNELKNNNIEYVIGQIKIYVASTLKPEYTQEYFHPGSTLKK